MDSMDVDSQEGATVIVIGVDPKPKPVMFHDQYCFMCSNGGETVMCNSPKCSRVMCIGSDAECLVSPPDDRYKDDDVLFICPPCHQDNDRRTNDRVPYHGFYHHVVSGLPATHWTGDLRTLQPLYHFPAKIRGSAQFSPRSKFQSGGIAILNFRLDTFNRDTGNLGHILEPFANAFFPEGGDTLLIYQDIVVSQSQREHEDQMHTIFKQLSAARSILKTVIVLITTHAQDGTGRLATSSTSYLTIDDWMNKIVTKPLLQAIAVLDTHWFLFCCGALVNVTTSCHSVKSFANMWKPTNLFAFTAPSFHPIFATTFLLNFFQHIVIEGRSFDSAVGLLLNASTLSRHSGIKRFWTRGSAVMDCELRWTHSRTQPLGELVPYQCPRCHCIQAWDQGKNNTDSSQLRDVKMTCSYKDARGKCAECIEFLSRRRFKTVKALEGAWVAFDVEKKDFL